MALGDSGIKHLNNLNPIFASFYLAYREKLVYPVDQKSILPISYIFRNKIAKIEKFLHHIWYMLQAFLLGSLKDLLYNNLESRNYFIPFCCALRSLFESQCFHRYLRVKVTELLSSRKKYEKALKSLFSREISDQKREGKELFKRKTRNVISWRITFCTSNNVLTLRII